MTHQTDQFESMRQHALEIFHAALNAVDPVEAVLRYVKRVDDGLQISEHRFALKDYDRILVVGAGKAGAPYRWCDCCQRGAWAAVGACAGP